MTDRHASGRQRRAAPSEPNLAAAAETTSASVAAPAQPVAPRRSRKRAPDVAPSPSAVAEWPEPQSEAQAPTPAPRRIDLSAVRVETLLYALILIAAVVTRFWDLGAKALHHDESLHAYYSWELATGLGYAYENALMHGPFLFHGTALVFMFFGDSDASSRYLPALFGVAMVGLPYLLRSPRLLGRWGALTSSFLILVSPVLLYQSRYLRHDIFTLVGTLLLAICVLRYWERPQRRWVAIGGGSIGFLLTNHEIVFAIVAVFGGFVYAGLLIDRFRAWLPVRRDLAVQLVTLHAATIVMLAGLWLFMPVRYKDAMFDIPWENPTTDVQLDYYRKLISNPLPMAMLGVVVLFLASLAILLNMARDPERREEGWLGSLLGDAQPQTFGAWWRNLLSDHSGLKIAGLLLIGIFATLFTTVFTELYGLITATVATDGALLYWLGQHDVQRGEQPWFYFLLLMPQYEYIAVIFGGAMALLTVVRTFGGLLGRLSSGPNLMPRLFLTVWFAAVLGGLSLAGEKMPWLTAHITLPATLLAGVLIGGLVERSLAVCEARRLEPTWKGPRLPWQELGLAAVILAAGAAWFVLAARLSFGHFVEASQAGGLTRVVTSYAADRWWWLALPPAVALVAIGTSSYLRGSRRAALASMASLVALLIALQTSAGFRLSYQNPDVPTEMMVYTQTSPDVTRVMEEITTLSFELTGGYGLDVWYDSGVSWPMQWYLRDFTNKRFYGSSLSGPPTDAEVVLVASDRDGQISRNLAGYTAQEYVLRWWFPEELYRNFAIAPEIDVGRSAWESVDQPHGLFDVLESAVESIDGTMSASGQARLFRLLVYRDIEHPLGHYRFKIYIRNDLLPLLNEIRY